MQRQRSTIDSFPESFEFDHGSSSSNTGVEEQPFWNNMLIPVETRLPGFSLSPNEANITYGNAGSHDGRSLNGWNLGEPHLTENTRAYVIHDEVKMDDVWPSLTAGAETAPRLEERHYEPASVLSLGSVNLNLSSSHAASGPLFLHNSVADDIPQNINLNAGYEGNSNNGGQFMEAIIAPHQYKSGGSETEQIPSNGSTDPFGTASGSGGFMVEDNNNRPGCSLDGRRLSCKRKALEGASEQSSLGGSSSSFQQAENSVWHAVPARYNAASSSNISTPTENPSGTNPPEQLNPRFGVGMGVASDRNPVLSVAGNVESSQRNFRLRINPAQRHDIGQPNLLSAGSATRRPHVWSPHHPSRLLSFNHSLNSRPTVAAALGNTNSPQSQSHMMPVPGILRNVHPFPLNGASSSRVGSSSSSPALSGDRGVVLREEANSRTISRNISEHPLFAHPTEMRNLARDPTNWILPNGSISTPGNIASTSRIGPNSGVHPSAPAWVPHHNPPSQFPQRLSEFARRSLLPSAGSESGGQSNSFPPLRPGLSASSREIVLSPGADHQGPHQPYTRSALWMDRRSDGGIPFSFRALAAAGEGRSRLVSELRHVLDLIRRGETVRFEDVMILDQSIFYGVADLHDRHRDMRLDVDNMSYEELLALEERIGNVNTGLTEEAILKCLKQRKYVSIYIGAPSEVEPCCICQEEYVDGDDLGVLDCRHDFHSSCIKQWLMQKNLCPICKTTALVP